MEKIVKASLDRIEGDYAVVYSDSDHQQFDFPLELVNDAQPGMRLTLHIEDDIVRSVEVNEKETDQARNRIRSKYERLRHGEHLNQQ